MRAALFAPLALVVLAAACGGHLGASTKSALTPRPTRYDLRLSWRPSTRTLTGRETVAFRNSGSRPLRSVWFRLWPNTGCRHPRLVVTRIDGAAVSGRRLRCSAVKLALPSALGPGGAARVKLRFVAQAPRSNDAFGRSTGVDLFGNAVPTLAVRGPDRWALYPASDLGESSFTLASGWRAVIDAPAGSTVAATGSHTPHARDFAFAIGLLRQRRAHVDGTRIRVLWAGRYSAEQAEDALRYAKTALRTFNSWYGPYGSSTLDIVLTRLPYAGIEYPEIVFSDPDRATITHEVAHQWFYAIVGDNQYREPWLDESFASWSEEQLNRGEYGCDPARPFGRFPYGLSRGLAYFDRHPARYTDDDYTDVVYRGGSCALSVLERELGRNRFLALLRREVARYRYRVVDSRDFIALIAAVDPAVARSWARLTHLR